MHSWLQLKGRWNQYQTLSNRFNLGYLAEMVISSKNLMNNYTASVLQAPAFTPTPHSEIVFNEAFRANQYVAFGLSPILKLSKLLHFRLDMYGFAPLYEIQKTVPENNPYVGIPHYGKFCTRLIIWVKRRSYCNCHSYVSVCTPTDTVIRRRISTLA